MAKQTKASSATETVRIFALGGLDEDGKNMLCVEIDGEIYIIEAGIKFPELKDSLGVECIVQDFSYLVEHEDKIAGVFITHGHDDIMGALPYLLKQIHTKVYTCPLAAKEIQRKLRKERITGSKIIAVERHDERVIGHHKVVFFPVTHAYPGTFGLAIQSKQGYIVYTGEFIEDYDDLEDPYRGDFTTVTSLGNEGVLVLLQESRGAERSGHTSPNHRISPNLESVFQAHEHQRVFVSVYTQSVYRIQEIIATSIKYDKKMYFYNKELRDILESLKMVGYVVPEKYIITPEQFNDDLEDVVVIISGQGPSLFRKLNNIANNEIEDIHFKSNDVVCIASQVISGVEKDFGAMENDIYKANGHVYVLDRDVLNMHPSKEDLKLMIFLMKPKYYIPIKGEYRLLHMNAEIALNQGYSPSNILILDNGQVATFKNKKLVSCALELELNDTMIDGKENWDMAGAVLRDREILSTDGVMILAIGIDAKSKKIINGPDIQTRGLVYLRDAEYITNDVSKIMESIIETDVKEKKYDNVETRDKIRDKVRDYLIKKTAKRPMILPVIMEIRT